MISTIQLYCLLLAGFLEGRQHGNQYFLETPSNMTVAEGDDIELKCKVANVKGQIQWTRQEFALGITEDTVSLTCDRCRLINENIDSSILRIRNVQLGQDNEFECQILPGKDHVKVLLRSIAYINIQVPPTEVLLSAPKTVIAGTTVLVACTAKSSKPATKFIWYKNASLLEDMHEDEDYLGHKINTITRVSRLKFITRAEDDGSVIRCIAQHPLLVSHEQREHFQRSVILQVLHSPSTGPEIIGDYRSKVRQGDVISLTCISKGGNPLPNLQWTRNQKPLVALFSNTTKNYKKLPKTEKLNGQSISHLDLIIGIHDDNVTYSCESYSNIMKKPLKSQNSLTFNVHFAPYSVKIEGPKNGRINDILPYNCTAKNGNPAPTLSWMINGIEFPALRTYTPFLDSSGDIIVTSGIDLPIQESNAAQISLSCTATSVDHDGNLMKEFSVLIITVLKPPSLPQISGSPELHALKEGEKVTITCSVDDGSPSPEIEWYLEDSDFPLSSYSKHKDLLPLSLLNLTVHRIDNDRMYKCMARNDANLHSPSIRTVRLQVFFPPNSVTITIKRPRGSMYNIIQSQALDEFSRSRQKYLMSSKIESVIEGEIIQLVCKTGSSNPAASVSWTENGLAHTTSFVTLENDLFGGKSTISVIEFKANSKDNNKFFRCLVKNPTFDSKFDMHANLTLNVLFPPKFDKSTLGPFTFIEGESRSINVTAIGNPFTISYNWTFPRKNSRLQFSESRLFLHNLSRKDSGVYKVTATNSYGNFTTVAEVFINVYYKPSINYLTSNTTIEEHSSVSFECKVDGNPLDDNSVEWIFVNEDPSSKGLFFTSSARHSIERNETTSTLTIISAHRGNMGFVICSVQNNISSLPKQERTYLSIHHKPWIVKSPKFTKYAIPKGNPAELRCRAIGNPKIQFNWDMTLGSKTSKILESDFHSGEYIKAPIEIQPYVWDSFLRLDSVRSDHYSTTFRCIAVNEIGNDSQILSLYPRGKPDPPTKVNAISRDDESVLLSWEPGFDGGYNQTFSITILEERTGKIVKHLEYSDVIGNFTFIHGLKARTPYSFKVFAKNRMGLSEPSDEVIKKTGAIKQYSNVDNTELVPKVMVIAIVISSILLLLLSLTIITCFLKHRKDSNENLQRTQQSPGNRSNDNHRRGKRSETRDSLMIERYTPTKYSNELFFPSFDKPRSDSTASSNPPNYHKLSRSLSINEPDHFMELPNDIFKSSSQHKNNYGSLQRQGRTSQESDVENDFIFENGGCMSHRNKNIRVQRAEPSSRAYSNGFAPRMNLDALSGLYGSDGNHASTPHEYDTPFTAKESLSCPREGLPLGPGTLKLGGIARYYRS